MSCAYSNAAQRVAVMTGLPYDITSTAMDIVQKQWDTMPHPHPDAIPSIAKILGLSDTCGTPSTVIRRVWAALLMLMQTYSYDPRRTRWMAVASLFGMPDDLLPEPAHPAVVEMVNRQLMITRPSQSPRVMQGLAALQQGAPIPTALIDEAIQARDREAIITWISYGAWDDRFETACDMMDDRDFSVIAWSGVIPRALVKRLTNERWTDSISWEFLPLSLWDRIPYESLARTGRARTAAAQFIRYPSLRSDNRLIAAMMQDAEAVVTVLRHEHLRDDRLIAAVAENPERAADVLYYIPELRTNDRLIEGVAQNAKAAADVIIHCPDLRTNDRLIEAATQDAEAAADVMLIANSTDDRLIPAIAENPEQAGRVLCYRQGLCDERLITSVVRSPSGMRFVYESRADLHSHPLIAEAIRTYFRRR